VTSRCCSTWRRAVVSNGRLRQAITAGETLPEGWALDGEGNVTHRSEEGQG